MGEVPDTFSLDTTCASCDKDFVCGFTQSDVTVGDEEAGGVVWDISYVSSTGACPHCGEDASGKVASVVGVHHGDDVFDLQDFHED